MRKALDQMYRLSGAAAAVFLAAICGVVLLQVAANILDVVIGWVSGRPYGLVVPSYAEFAGFFLAATSFLALAYTLRRGAHVRVSMVIQTLTRRRRRIVEVWCCGAGALMSGFFAAFTIGLVVESLEFGDVSPGMIPVPLWIPQMAMAAGLIVLTVALIDECVEALAGREPAYVHGRFADGDAGQADAVDAAADRAE